MEAALRLGARDASAVGADHGLDDLELHVYRGGEHAFMRDVGARHDPVLTDLAITEAVSFLTAR